MGIDNFNDQNGGHLAPVQPALGPLRRWNVIRSENQTIGVIQVYRELAGTITGQFVAAHGSTIGWANVGQCAGFSQHSQPVADQSRLTLAVSPLQQACVVALPLQPAVRKAKVHSKII